MAQIKIEVTFNTNEETLEQALAKLHAPTIDADALGEAVTREVQARLTSSKREDTVVAAEKQSNPETAPEMESASGSAATTDSSESDPAPEEKPVTKTDVRAMATALTKAGKRDTLKAIFKKLGAEKLSDIQEKDYPALMRELVAANA